MLEELKKQFTALKLLIILLIIAVSIYLLQIAWQVLSNFSDILIMLILAWLLSFILEPLVHQVSRFTKLPKLISAFIVYAFFAILFAVMIFLFIPIVIGQFETLSKVIPTFLSPYPQFAHSWDKTVTNSVDVFISIIPSLATVITDTVLMLILSFYFIIEKQKITEEIYKFLPFNLHGDLKFIQGVVNSTFSTYLRIQIIFGIIAAISTWIVLTLFGIDFAASLSLVAGIITIIPVLGQFLGAIPAAFVVLITKPNAPTEAVIIFAILVIIQQIAFNVLGPKLMGNAFKLHPVIVFLAIIIGFKISGALGAVFVVPILAIVIIVVRQLGPYFINHPESLEK